MRLDRFRSPGRALPVVAFLAFLGTAAVATQPLSFDSLTRLPANADALVFAWTLKEMCGGLAQPWDAFRGNMFYPDTASLLYTEPLVGLAVQVAPLCALGMDHVTLYNATYAVVLAMSALGAWLLAREITGSPPAALVAATVFAFTTANYDSAARIQVVASQWTPFCFLYLIRFCREGRLKDAVLMGGAFAMQALTCTYYEIFLAILLVLSVPLWIGLAGGMARARERIPGVTAAVLIAGALVLPVNVVQRLHLDPVLVTRPQAQQITLSFFTEVLPTNLIYGGVLGRTRMAYDALYFPGLVPLGLALLFVFWTLRGRGNGSETQAGLKPLVFVGVAAFLLALGTRVSTPWGEIPGPLSLFSGVPGLGQARVPSRFLMFSRLALAIVAASGARLVLSRFPKRPRIWASILALACFAEHWSVPLDSWVVPTRNQLPAVYQWLEKSGPSIGPILEFPPSLHRLRREESAWLHTAAFHGLPMANGFSSFRPPWFEFVMEAALQWPDERLLVILREIGVRTIVVHPRPRGLPEVDGAGAALLDYAASHPEQLRLLKSFSDSDRWPGIWSRLGDEQVFAIGPGAPPLTFSPLGPSIDRRGWSCRSTEPDCERAIDGDPATLLRGREPQGTGQFLKVWFKEPTDIQAVSIHLGRFPEGFPREPVIRLLVGDAWIAVDAKLDVQSFLSDMMQRSTNPAMSWRFPVVRATGFEIRLRSGGQRFRELGIPEVSAHGSVGPSSEDASPTAAPSTQTTRLSARPLSRDRSP